MFDRVELIETSGSYRPASLLSALSGRPRNSPGWGMLVAVKSGTVIGPDGEREQITSGRDRVSPEHWLASEYPEWFKPCDRRDKQTITAHRANCRSKLRQLEGTTRTASPTPKTDNYYGLGPSPSQARKPDWALDVPRTETTWRL